MRQMACILVLGEVLWDVFPDSVRLGGAPLNFAAHASRLGHEPRLLSAVGSDELGRNTIAAIVRLGLDTGGIQVSGSHETGTARVQLGPGGQADFTIVRPAAYDDLDLSDEELARLAGWQPHTLYFGTLFASRESGRATLFRLLAAVPDAARFYDLNLRPGSDSPSLVSELLGHADIVKLNDAELDVVHRYTDLPGDLEGFCRAGAHRYGWQAACITLGARGCAILVAGEYAQVPGLLVTQADPVGAGDAFAAAMLHGLEQGWPAAKTAAFGNALGALVASRPGAIPDWDPSELI